MKIQLASDLHLEFLTQLFPSERLIEPQPDADVLVLAGDIANGTLGIRRFADWPVPVLYVAGNHEAYGEDQDEVLVALRDAARGTSVRFLERDRLDLDGVRFLGCTLWTSYDLDAATGTTRRAAMDAANRSVYDHQVIRLAERAFRPEDARGIHLESRRWLEAELARPFDGPTVVVTHHGVHPDSVHPRFAGSDVNPAFITDLGPLLDRADLWLHGHVHDSFDYRVGRARVVANPRGYAANRNAIEDIAALEAENPAWDPTCVVALPTPGHAASAETIAS